MMRPPSNQTKQKIPRVDMETTKVGIVDSLMYPSWTWQADRDEQINGQFAQPCWAKSRPADLSFRYPRALPS